jgi:predicted RNase H-like HicB family nuclease
MKLKTVIEVWDDGTYSAYVVNAKKHNISAQGKSVEEAKSKLVEAISDYEKMYLDSGKPIDKEIVNPVFEYKYDMSSFFNYFDCINTSKLAIKADINPSLLRQYKKKITLASGKQIEKLQKAINLLGNELAAVRL